RRVAGLEAELERPSSQVADARDVVGLPREALLGADDPGVELRSGGREVRREEAVERVGEVPGLERLAVREAHAGPEVEGVDETVVRDRPGLGELGDERERIPGRRRRVVEERVEEQVER